MSVNKTIHGAWAISDIINGYLVQRQYMGYTKKVAISLFKSEINNLTSKK